MWCTGSSWSWVRILLSFTPICFLSNWRELDFHERFHLEISSKCDIKAENSSTLCKFRKGRKWLQPMGSNPDRFSRLVRQKRETERKTLLAGCIWRRSHSQGRGTFKAERYLHFFRYTRDRAIDIPLSVRGLFLEKLFYVCRVCTQDQSFNYFEIDTMRLSVNEAKLTGLWAGNCCTIKLVFISNFAFGYHAFRETGSQCSNRCPN